MTSVTASGAPNKVAVTLHLTPVDAGNLEAMAYAGYRRLRDDCTPEAQALARDLLNHILDAIQPLLAVRDGKANASDG